MHFKSVTSLTFDLVSDRAVVGQGRSFLKFSVVLLKPQVTRVILLVVGWSCSLVEKQSKTKKY